MDDICSYGGTFKGLAKELKNKGADKIYLIVSHWEGVANIKQLEECGIFLIYTTDSLAKTEDQAGLISIDVEKLM